MPTEISNNLEQQLRGIHMPEAISWWPLAIGWWLLIALGLLALVFLLFKLYRTKQTNRYRKAAINELQITLEKWQENQDIANYLQDANDILKRVVRRFNLNSGSQSGSEWAKTLNQFASQPLQEQTVKALCIDCYQSKPKANIPQLHRQLEQWLNTHRQKNSGGSHA